jgi:hypothetical protein
MEAILFDDDLISVYTREDALRDGVLIDVSTVAEEEGFKIPVAITVAAFRSIEPSVEEICCGQDLRGRLHDLFWMMRAALRRKSSFEASRIDFKVLLGAGGNQKCFPLSAHLHPGDRGEPVITIMLPHED